VGIDSVWTDDFLASLPIPPLGALLDGGRELSEEDEGLGFGAAALVAAASENISVSIVDLVGLGLKGL
jgi:hypothetical protein